MPVKRSLKYILAVETFLLATIGAGIFTLQKPSSYYLYELLGAITAAILTTFGLLRMKDLT